MTAPLKAVLLLLAAAGTSPVSTPAARGDDSRDGPALEGVHVVKPGESLAQIARVALGDSALWPALYRANRDQIKDPARVYPGQKLSIPDVGDEERRALRQAAAREPAAPTPK